MNKFNDEMTYYAGRGPMQSQYDKLIREKASLLWSVSVFQDMLSYRATYDLFWDSIVDGAAYGDDAKISAENQMTGKIMNVLDYLMKTSRRAKP